MTNYDWVHVLLKMWVCVCVCVQVGRHGPAACCSTTSRWAPRTPSSSAWRQQTTRRWPRSGWLRCTRYDNQDPRLSLRCTYGLIIPLTLFKHTLITLFIMWGCNKGIWVISAFSFSHACSVSAHLLHSVKPEDIWKPELKMISILIDSQVNREFISRSKIDLEKT